MDAEIIAIGTELTSGAKLDTNSQWLSLQLADLGIPVTYHTTVADDLEANVDVLRDAVQRVDLVVVTGGLGPTQDDLTRFALAQLLDAELSPHAPSLAFIERFFQTRGRVMPETNRVQALFPAGAEPLENPIGTAPGIWCTVPRAGRTECRLACLPGVPSEMHRMFFEQVRPRLPGGRIVIRRARINCFGIGESATEELLGNLTERGRDPEIGITAHEATITLRIIAHGMNEEECLHKINTASAEIRRRLPQYVFGVEDEELEDVVVRELISRGESLATIEVGTGGLLAQRLAHVPDADQCFRHGTVLSKIGPGIIETALSARTRHRTDHVLVVGAEQFDPGPAGTAVSSIPIVLASGELTPRRIHVDWSGNPAITRVRATKTALNFLRRRLLAADRQ